MKKLTNKYYQLKEFIENSDLDAKIPDHLKHYNAVLDVAHDAWKVYGTAIGSHNKRLNMASKLVHTKFPELSVGSCKNYVFQAINIYQSQNIIDKAAWKQLKLEELDKLLALAYKMNKIEEARRIIHDQNELMGLFKEEPPKIPDEVFAPRLKIFTVDISDVGGEKVNRKQLYRDMKETYLGKLNTSEKNKLLEDLDITDAEFEEIKQDEKTERIRKKLSLNENSK